MMRRSRIGFGCSSRSRLSRSRERSRRSDRRRGDVDPAQPGPPDARAAIAWKLRDAAGGGFSTHVFVRITCPEGDAPTTAYANPDDRGVDAARALAPPGGPGRSPLGRGATVLPLTNPASAIGGFA
jgi:hypothetical protein